MTVRRVQPDTTPRLDERGSVLLFALVVMILSGTLVAGLMFYAQSSVKSQRSYKVRTERSDRAEDAMGLMIAVMRRPQGLVTPDGQLEARTNVLGCASGCGTADGTPVVRTYKVVTVTCTAASGSGAVKANGTYSDRTVTCTTTEPSAPAPFHFRLRFVDLGGVNLGQSVQVVDNDFGDP